MSYNLVIVESQGKIQAINKYLNNNPDLKKKYGKFVVAASMGHIRDLKKKSLSINIDKDFEPQYEFSADKKTVISDLVNKAKGASDVFIGSDNDAEGHFIAESIRVALKLGNNYKRILFTEITPKALQYAIEHPTKIDPYQLESQQCRRVLDRLVGFKLSPLLWKKFKAENITLSAGRVQSAVMHLIVQREKEIKNFKSSPYWHVSGDFLLKLDKEKISLDDSRMYKDGNIYKTENVKDIDSLFKTISNKWSVTDVKTKTSKQNPDPPFITSTLQQEASSKLKIGIKKVMELAQKLYEEGKITYMRTDSFNMSEDFKKDTKVFISNTYGNQYVGDGALHKKTVKGAQEAHECIRPTNINEVDITSSAAASLTQAHRSLYELIWKRSVAFLMKPAVFDELEISFKDDKMAKNMYFLSNFKKVQFNGFLIVYGVGNESNNFASVLQILKNNKYDLSCSELRAKNTHTSPPTRFNDSSIVKAMEQAGIGRPSTYAATLEKLYDKKYIIRGDVPGENKETIDYVLNPATKKVKEVKGKTDVGAEKSKIIPTDIGTGIDKYLEENFDYITDKTFTSNMESELDRISEGKKERLDVLNTFWKRFSNDLDEQLKVKGDKQTIKTENKTLKVNGVEYTVKLGKYGPVIEYMTSDKKNYIPLGGFLSITKKNYMDVTVEDLKFLTSLPRTFEQIDKKAVSLVIGPYGLYLKHGTNNIKIPFAKQLEYIEKKTFSQEQLKGFIDYKSKNSGKSASKSASKTPKTV